MATYLNGYQTLISPYVSNSITFLGAGTISTTNNGILNLLPNGTGYTKIGDASNTSHTLNTNDDLMVTGKVEVDGNFYADLEGYFYNTVYYIYQNKGYVTINPSPSSAVNIGVGADSDGARRNIVFCTTANVATNYAHTASTNPTLFFHSATTTATEWGSVTHDQTDFVISTGKGMIKLVPVAGSPVQIGDAGSTSHTLNTNDDLMVTGKLEVDGAAYLDSTLEVGSTASITGDVSAAGGFVHHLGIWGQDNVAASQTNAYLIYNMTTGRATIPMVRAGSIIGLAIIFNSDCTAGSLTAEVTKNGVGTGLTVVLDTSVTKATQTTQAKDTDTFVAGDLIGINITTTADWAPTNRSITLTILVEC